jgi:hypothetical protein
MCVFLKALRFKDWVRFKHTVSISVDDYGGVANTLGESRLRSRITVDEEKSRIVNRNRRRNRQPISLKSDNLYQST